MEEGRGEGEGGRGEQRREGRGESEGQGGAGRGEGEGGARRGQGAAAARSRPRGPRSRLVLPRSPRAPRSLSRQQESSRDARSRRRCPGLALLDTTGERAGEPGSVSPVPELPQAPQLFPEGPDCCPGLCRLCSTVFYCRQSTDPHKPDSAFIPPPSFSLQRFLGKGHSWGRVASFSLGFPGAAGLPAPSPDDSIISRISLPA